jgi:hypothetical protein
MDKIMDRIKGSGESGPDRSDPSQRRVRFSVWYFIVAYHESGHALVAMLLPGTDPVSKVSIAPRGIAALGYTQQLPTEDRYLMTRDELMDRLQVLLILSGLQLRMV